MYASHGIGYETIKIEQADRLARAQRRMALSSQESTRGPSIHALPTLPRRAVVALASLVLALGVMAGAAAANDGTPSGSSAGSGSACVRVTNGPLVC